MLTQRELKIMATDTVDWYAEVFPDDWESRVERYAESRYSEFAIELRKAAKRTKRRLGDYWAN